MVLQPVSQATELPDQFGELLSGANARLSRRKDKPLQMTERIAHFERDLIYSEQLVNDVLDELVEFIRKAGQDDNTAREFDEWTGELDLAEAFNAYENKVIPVMNEHAAILRKIVEGWNRMAEAGEIEPDLPPELVGRAAQLDVRIKGHIEAVTKKQDNDLVARLLIRVAGIRKLTHAEEMRMYDAAREAVPAPGYPSVHRSDWYGDDGR